MCKFATTIIIGLLSNVLASAISHFSQRILYDPLQHKEKAIPSFYVHHSPSHLFNNGQGLS